MKLKKRKRGISFPAMLTVVIFVVSTVLGIIFYVRFQIKLTEKNIDFSEEVVNAKTDISAIQYIISQNQISDALEIASLASYFNLQVSSVNGVVYQFSRDLESSSRIVTGYLAPQTEIITTYEEMFINTGLEETFTLSPLINATTMLAEYVETYIPDSFSGLEVDGDLSSFQSTVDYFRSLTNDYYTIKPPTEITSKVNPVINDYIFIDGDVFLNNKNLTVNEGYTLVIDGNLTTDRNCTINGNIIINGDFIIEGRNRDSRNIVGTFYVNGDVSIVRKTTIGSPSRPSFMFSTGTVTVANQVTIYGFFIADAFYGSYGNTFVTGGVYTTNETVVKNSNVTTYDDLTTEDLINYGVATTIVVESTSGTSSFTFTYPNLE
jgi:hypothetical protein